MKALRVRQRNARIRRFIQTTHVHVEVERNINNAAAENRGDNVVELDNYKVRLNAYEEPLKEIRDSL